MDKAGWSSETKRAYQNQNQNLSSEDLSMLHSEISETNQKQTGVVTRTYEILTHYFYAKAAGGETFGPVERIQQRFGMTLERRYRLRSGQFLYLARTYWTFKIEVGDLFPEYTSLALTRILSQIESDTGSLFFPMPGPLQIPADQRRQAQTEFLRKVAPTIDIAGFMRDNPFVR